ncbi:hypothetical protein CCACVL1_21545 [Corchorus capsularis]|uniref:Uncharacterized protein n=1 Tax=Corchorus capsularis TaxID=210143 RepID=A0A1R3H4U3_COCAP|nr:hypothetical protein CCACVL1_21545 [Corchorus capsularis]
MLFLLSAAFFIGSAFTITDYKERILGWGSVLVSQYTRPMMCETQCRAYGTEALPKGIISETSNLEMRPLWGQQNKKFPESDFVVMLFHYDGIVDQWKDFEWNDRAIHVAAVNQTKWWFAKRFLHPDIVSEYSYIFLWDEDLGVDHFDAKRYQTDNLAVVQLTWCNMASPRASICEAMSASRATLSKKSKYLSIVKKEGLEISQPALDPEKSELHHPITRRDKDSTVHRRTYAVIGKTRCNENSTGPPCTGFVEMMAPVFSIASWRCAWHMVQSDLVYGWGLDFELGYCAQATFGDRTQKIGIVDAEYVVHNALPTLGGVAAKKVQSSSNETDVRSMVIKQSYAELETFKSRWRRAVKQDSCWFDRLQQYTKRSPR